MLSQKTGADIGFIILKVFFIHQHRYNKKEIEDGVKNTGR